MANDYTQQVQEEDHFLLAVFEGYCIHRNNEERKKRLQKKKKHRKRKGYISPFSFCDKRVIQFFIR